MIGRLLATVTLLLLPLLAAAEPPDYPSVLPGVALSFPADHGAHPAFRTEWWYVTGWLDLADGSHLGFQVTFFRSRPDVDQHNPSSFAAKQILFAHAAISDPAIGHLLDGQRIARTGFGLAEAATGDLSIVLDDWSLRRDADDRVIVRAAGDDFALALDLTPTQKILLEGDAGYSRKGPLAEEASRYYSLPHLKVSGTVTRGGRVVTVGGTAWLDREWSSTLLDPAAVGWDWVGLNLDDGAALMAFQVRDQTGKALWAGGTLRDRDGGVTSLAPDDVRFTADRLWHSPRTAIDYPVGQDLAIRLAAGWQRWRLTPLLDDQELDSRRSGGPIYWEGAVTVPGGRGYLELTGYGERLRL